MSARIIQLFKLVLYVLVLFYFSNNSSAENLFISNKNCSCKSMLGDGLDSSIQYNFGRFKGKCVDSCRFRTPILINPTNLSNERNVNIVTNVLHDGKFWIADIPFNSFYKAEIGFEEFIPEVFHVFIILNTSKKNPIILRSQTDKREIQVVSTLVISPEGIPPMGEKYNIYDAFSGNYLMGIRFLTKSSMLDWAVNKMKHSIRIYQLNIEKKDILNIYKSALQILVSNNYNNKYQLFTNNCATKSLDLIGAIKFSSVENFDFHKYLNKIERAFPVLAPVGTFRLLRSRNLIDTNELELITEYKK